MVFENFFVATLIYFRVVVCVRCRIKRRRVSAESVSVFIVAKGPPQIVEAVQVTRRCVLVVLRRGR